MSPPRARPDPLTRAEIARTALAVVDRDGVDHLTMRRLAEDLKVAPMAVYHHFANKAEILQAAADQVWLEVVLGTQDHEDPIEAILGPFLAVRQAFGDHVEITRFAFGSPTTEDAVHLMALGVVERFERAGFQGGHVGAAYHALATYTFGAALLHAERIILDRSTSHAVSEIGSLAPGDRVAEESSRPAYDSVRAAMQTDIGLVRFERGLRDVMAGLTTRYLQA